MKKVILLLVAAALVVGGWYAYDHMQREKREALKLTKDGKDAGMDYTPQIVEGPGRSPLSGRTCDAWQRRPMAVMYTGDSGTRQWMANTSKAEIMVEMPHRSVHGGTRLMGIFQCDAPDVVGPMRSGRTDFLSVAGAYDAIFAPWGGSSIMKNLLKQGVNDHIDCNGEVAPDGGDACFRRSDGPKSTMDKASANVQKLYARADSLGYRKETRFNGQRFQTDIAMAQRPEVGSLKIDFERPFRVVYQYDKPTNTYKRYFNKEPDIDYATGQQVAPKNVIVIKSKKNIFSTKEDYVGRGLKDPWDGIDEEHRKNDSEQYPNMELGDPWFDTEYSGEARIYMNGREIVGTWSREKGLDKPFTFKDGQGSPIALVEGQTWIEVPEKNRLVRWSLKPADLGGPEEDAAGNTDTAKETSKTDTTAMTAQ